MAIPKVPRDSGLFEKNVCDKINKKVQIITDNISELSAPSLAPYYDVHNIPVRLDVTTLSSSYSSSDDNYYYEYTYTCDIALSTNNSFSIGSDDCKVNILNFTMKLTNCVYSYRYKSKESGSSWSDWQRSSREVYYDISSGASPKMKIGKVQKSPLTDVWFATESTSTSLCLVNIPQGTNDIYIIPNGVSEINVYCWYV